MRGTTTAPLIGLRQGGHIASVGLDASAPVAVHRRKIRIGHDDVVAKRLGVLRDPLALGRGFQHNSHRPSSPEQGGQAVAGRRDASVLHLTVVHHDPDLAFLLVEIEGTIRHGLVFSFAPQERVSAMWSASTTSLRRPAASSYLRAGRRR
jgi:hypothetical protein